MNERCIFLQENIMAVIASLEEEKQRAKCFAKLHANDPELARAWEEKATHMDDAAMLIREAYIV